jgi:hypothetical protein
MFLKLSRLAYGFAVATMLATVLISPAAFAGVVDTFSIAPSSITQGGSTTENLSLQVSPDSGYWGAFFTGGTATFTSGDGQTQTQSIAYGTNFESFTQTFNYLSSGNVTPGFSFTAQYADEYTYYGSYYVSRGYWQSYYCGFFCGYDSYWVDTSYWQSYSQTEYAYATVTGNGTADLSVISSPSFSSAVPEPSTWAMMTLGFAGVGFMAYRRKSKPVLMALIHDHKV